MKYEYNKKFKGIIVSPSNAKECFESIIEIGFDYDGYHKAEDLKDIIDDLVDFAKNGLYFITQNKITPNDTKEEDLKSYTKAFKEQEENDKTLDDYRRHSS